MTREEVVTFGPGGGLCGIVTHPVPAASGIGVLILNAGIVHRVGPNRLHVTLARLLAERGAMALRFDLSGLGESTPAADGAGYGERVLREARAAVDLLASRGATRAVVLGICSGADNGLRAAKADRRIVGAVLIEGYAWESLGQHLEYLARRAASLRTWKRVVRGGIDWRGVFLRVRAARRPVAPSGPLEEGDLDPLQQPPPQTVADDLVAVAEGGARMLLVYSKEGEPYYNFRRHFRRGIRRFEARGQVRVQAFAAANHTFSPPGVQARLCDLVGEWISALGGGQDG